MDENNNRVVPREGEGLKFNVAPGQRMLLMLCAIVLCLLLGAVAVAIVQGSTPTTPRLRIGAVLQDVMVFIAPAILTAVVVSRRPGRLLCVDRGPRVSMLLMTLATLIVAIPAMNVVVEWNASLPLAGGLAEAEAKAAETIQMLMGGTGAGSLVISLLIIGVLAGFSEELLFRGCIQRVLATGGMNRHAAIWITAIVFSAVHMQMAGFVPRLLLGAFFGYALMWSGSLWVPVAAHILNNMLAATSMWLQERGVAEASAIDHIGTEYWWLAILSVVATAAMLTGLSRSACGGTRNCDRDTFRGQ